MATSNFPTDGGSAFPRPHSDCGDSCIDSQAGMSLRDYFAGQAMQSMFAGEGARVVAARDSRYDETNWAEVVALNAYEMADAMLAERAKAEGR